MSDLLTIGASGLRVYTAALGAIGDNIANSQTEGYARRSVEIGELTAGSQSNLYYKRLARFDGAIVKGVSRSTDIFRTADARIAGADYGRAQTVSTWLQNAETTLGSEIGTSLATMFGDGDRLAADPNGERPRIALLDSIQRAASAIRTSATDLARTSSTLGDAAQTAVDETNADLKGLASVNLAIRRQIKGSTAMAELEDQRDLYLNNIANRTGATASIDSLGVASVKIGGATMVDVEKTATISLVRAVDGSLSLTSTYQGTTAPLAGIGGSLEGFQSAASSVVDRRNAIAAHATKFTTAINGWNAAGTTPSGTGGPALVSMGADATTLAALSNNAGDIAAASGGVSNANALALSTVRTASGLESMAATIVTQHATATATAREAETLADKRRDIAYSARDLVEGVDLDREAADLIRFQQAYQGAARVVQIAKELIDTVMAILR